jgi:hypothetical protein
MGSILRVVSKLFVCDVAGFQTDEFVLNLGTKDIGEVRKVDIGLASKQSAGGMMGSVLGVDWCLEACELTHMNSQTRQFFPYGDWLKKAKKRVTLTPGSAGAKVQYKVVVKTSDLRGAGTDAKVSMVMTGERDGGKTTTGPHKLDNSANNFERNMVLRPTNYSPHPQFSIESGSPYGFPYAAVNWCVCVCVCVCVCACV